MLEANRLTCYRGDRCLFEDIDLALSESELVQVYGGNGSGKTTLLRILCGLSAPTEGEVRYRGGSVTDSPVRLRREMHYLGHQDGVKLTLTPRENLRFAAGLAADPMMDAADDALARLGLARYRDQVTRQLSTGQRRRVALARLLIIRAPLWILDEPFTALDAQGADTLHEVIETHLAAAGAVVLTSHHPLDLDQSRHGRLDLGP